MVRKFFYEYRNKTKGMEMKAPDENSELLAFFKALADANRLKIVGLLARQSYTVEQLSGILGLSASTVSHHLSKLAEAGLVSATARSYYNDYRLETGQLEAMSRRLLAAETLPNVAASVDASADERKTVNAYLLPDGRLKTIPSQRKKLLAVLRHIARAFEPGRRYSEKEVNEILGQFQEDTASLRRELVGSKLMEREGGGGAYWRVDRED
jgi:DNA-binding HxlR family transcriptional regulator